MACSASSGSRRAHGGPRQSRSSCSCTGPAGGKQYLNISRWREGRPPASSPSSRRRSCTASATTSNDGMDDGELVRPPSGRKVRSVTRAAAVPSADPLKLSPTQRQRDAPVGTTLLWTRWWPTSRPTSDRHQTHVHRRLLQRREMVSRLLSCCHLFAAMASHAGHMHIPPAPLGARRVPFFAPSATRTIATFHPARRHDAVVQGAINFPFIQRTSVVPYLQQEPANARVGAHDVERPPDRALELSTAWRATQAVRLPAHRGNTHAYPNGQLQGGDMADRTWRSLRRTSCRRLPSRQSRCAT
jgi:hypothetical protein